MNANDCLDMSAFPDLGPDEVAPPELLAGLHTDFLGAAETRVYDSGWSAMLEQATAPTDLFTDSLAGFADAESSPGVDDHPNHPGGFDTVGGVVGHERLHHDHEHNHAHDRDFGDGLSLDQHGDHDGDDLLGPHHDEDAL